MNLPTRKAKVGKARDQSSHLGPVGSCALGEHFTREAGAPRGWPVAWRSGWPSWAERGVRVLGQTLLVPCGWPGLDGGASPGASRPVGACGEPAGRPAPPGAHSVLCRRRPASLQHPIENIPAVEPLEEESFKMKNGVAALPTPDPCPRSWSAPGPVKQREPTLPVGQDPRGSLKVSFGWKLGPPS